MSNPSPCLHLTKKSCDLESDCAWHRRGRDGRKAHCALKPNRRRSPSPSIRRRRKSPSIRRRRSPSPSIRRRRPNRSSPIRRRSPSPSIRRRRRSPALTRRSPSPSNRRRIRNPTLTRSSKPNMNQNKGFEGLIYFRSNSNGPHIDDVDARIEITQNIQEVVAEIMESYDLNLTTIQAQDEWNTDTPYMNVVFVDVAGTGKLSNIRKLKTDIMNENLVIETPELTLTVTNNDGYIEIK